jgi:hypothetical protein
VEPFSFVKWKCVIIEVPTFKYVAIDMLQVFVPLILLAIFSLTIFRIDTGKSTNTGLNLLAYRLVNAASLMIAYVSLIPIIQESLPPMPGVTLIEILAYMLTLPIFLSLLSSLLSYTVTITEWNNTYLVIRDWVFVIALTISIINAFIIAILFLAYGMKDYRMTNEEPLKYRKKRRIVYKAPKYMLFMEKVIKNRPECKIKKM